VTLTTLQRGGPPREDRRHKRRRAGGALTASALALVLAASMTPAANAAIGSGGANGGSGGHSGEYISVINIDDAWAATPVQGWGESSIQYFVDQFRSHVNSDYGFNAIDGNWNNHSVFSRENVDIACRGAIDEAISRDSGATQARVVSMAVSWRVSGSTNSVVVSGQAKGGYRSDVVNLWDSSGFVNHTAESRADIRAKHLEQIDGMGSSIRVTCVALNDTEVVRDYPLSITTDRANTFSLSGGTGAVHDRIHANRGDSTISENLNGQVVLHWDGVTGQAATSRTKNVTIANTGTTNSPTFTPADFGWTVWPAGQFWFDVIIPKQGSMAAGVNTPDRDPRETWSAEFDLDITTDHSGGFSLAGSTGPVSDLVHASSNGSRVGGTVNANVILNWDGFGSNAAPKAATKAFAVRLDGDTRTPNFTPADFGWNAWPAGRFWFDIRVPEQSLMSGAVDTPDRDPRETWVATPPPPEKILTSGPQADELGDNEVLASGMSYDARISATASGYTSMRITDTIHTDQVFIGSATADVNSAPYVLAPDGSRVSGATVSINRGTAGRVVVSATFSGIPDRFQGQDYTLVVPTYVLPTGADYEIEDDSRVCYAPGVSGIERCLDGNDEGTRKVTPAPDKVWVLDEEGALVASDPAHTNQQGVDQKTFAPGSAIAAVVNGRVPANLAENLTQYSITDDWTGAAQYVDFSDASRVKVFAGGIDVTSQFTVAVNGTTTTATANAAFLATTKGLSADRPVKLVISGEFRNDYDTGGELARLSNAGSERWNNETVPTNTPPVFTTTPTPDKAWVLDEDGALVVNDPEWTNEVGMDGKTFLMNDEVYAVVNGRIPGNLGRALDNYSITDDWSDGIEYVDFSDASLVQVYFGGQRVTGEFDIAIANGVTTATARQAFLDRTAGLDGDVQVKLVIGGKFRDDYDTQGELVRLLNKGSETWNNRTQPTNEPPVYTWTPDPDKFVIGSGEESGDNTGANIDGMSVWPGQKLEYSIGIDLRIPGNTARGVKSLAVEDAYDPFVTPDFETIEFWDGRDDRGRPTVVPASNYKVTVNEENHTFRVDFTEDWINANVNNPDGSANSEWLTKGWLTMRFTAAVNDDIAGGDTVENQAFQIINDARTETEIPTVRIPTVEPDKEDLNTDLVDIDGKTVVAGDVILYRLTLDGGPARSELAYNVHKLGMVDDFDDEYLDLSVEGIRVTEKDTGADVTDKFNVQIIDGVAYIFAKQVDSVNFKGQTISGDPQPEDLAVYSTAPIDPHTTPIIDQSLLGKDYYVTLATTVVKELDGYVIENQATQNIQNTWHQTKIVSNPLKDIDPDKDVVVSEETKDDSIDGTEVALNSDFNYRLNSSEIPANRAYEASQWSITDTFNPVFDQYTGIWAAYANEDIYDGDTLVYAKGDLLQDSAGHETEPGSAMFDVTFDQESYTFKIEATQKFLDLVNTRTDLSQSFSVYTKMIRIAPSERVENQATESYNDYERDTNIVWTSTPEHPAIDVEKYTLSEGIIDGDRDDVRLAYEMTPEQLAMQGEGDNAVQTGVEVGITVTNTGDVKLVDVVLTDETHQGTWGDVDDLLCVAPEGTALEDQVVVEGSETAWVEMSAITELEVGQSVDCVGVLRGMEPGMTHGDTVTATGKSVFTGKEVSDDDPWFAKAPSEVGIDVEKYTLEEGVTDGDRDVFKDALTLTPEQAENGLLIGIDVTNTGDEPLTDLKLEDATHEATTGDVTGIKWWTAVDEDAKQAIIDRYEADKAAAEAAPEGDPVTVEDETEAPAEGSDAEEIVDLEDEGAAAPSPDEAVAPVVDEQEAAKPVLRAPVFEAFDGVEYQVRELDELTVLAPGETVLLVGTLTGVEPGTAHGDTFTASGKGVYSGDEVSDDDPWFGKLPSPEVPDPECPVCEKPTPDPEDPPKIVTTGDGFAEGNNLMVAGGVLLALLALIGAGGYAYRVRRMEQAEAGEDS